MSAGLRLLQCHLGADHQLALQAAGARAAQWEAEYVGRFVVIEVALVELVNRGVVYEGQTDVGVGLALTFENSARYGAHSTAVDGDGFLRRSDGDFAHGGPWGGARGGWVVKRGSPPHGPRFTPHATIAALR